MHSENPAIEVNNVTHISSVLTSIRFDNGTTSLIANRLATICNFAALMSLRTCDCNEVGTLTTAQTGKLLHSQNTPKTY